MGLNLANQHLLGAVTVDDQVDQVRAAGLDVHLLELGAVQDQGRGRRVVPVDDRGKLALAVKAARALAEELAGGGVQLHGWASGWGGVVMIPRRAISANPPHVAGGPRHAEPTASPTASGRLSGPPAPVLYATPQMYGAQTTYAGSVSYTHLRAHETRHDIVCRLL